MSDAVRSDRVAEQTGAIYDPGDPPWPPPEVDLSLVRWSLTLTPAERLEGLRNWSRFITRALNAKGSRSADNL
jgi:hypothetical protein